MGVVLLFKRETKVIRFLSFRSRTNAELIAAYNGSTDLDESWYENSLYSGPALRTLFRFLYALSQKNLRFLQGSG